MEPNPGSYHLPHAQDTTQDMHGTGAATPTQKLRRCGLCRQPGHDRRTCPVTRDTPEMPTRSSTWPARSGSASGSQNLPEPAAECRQQVLPSAGSPKRLRIGSNSCGKGVQAQDGVGPQPMDPFSMHQLPVQPPVGQPPAQPPAAVDQPPVGQPPVGRPHVEPLHNEMEEAYVQMELQWLEEPLDGLLQVAPEAGMDCSEGDLDDVLQLAEQQQQQHECLSIFDADMPAPTEEFLDVACALYTT